MFINFQAEALALGVACVGLIPEWSASSLVILVRLPEFKMGKTRRVPPCRDGSGCSVGTSREKGP